MISRYKYWFAAVLVVAVSLLGIVQISKDKSWTLEKYYSQKVDWKDCYGGYECATFQVPVDYSKIDNQSFKLKALRHRADDEKMRIGSLFVNPGGPGGSATDYAYSAESIVSPEIYQRYDIVGFDPRGISSSEPIRCLSNKEEDEFLDASASSADSVEVANLVEISKNFAEKCAKAAGNKLGHYSTLEAAKDMEVLRRAMGEAKLNYLGKSYGTYLGTLYAALFPNSVGKFVLDGAVAPEISLRDQEIAQAIGFDLALRKYLSKNKKVSLETILNLISTSQTNPLKSKSGRILSESLVVTALAQSLYDSQTGWHELNEALSQAITRDNPTKLFQLADDYNNRDSSGNFYSNQNDISIMVTCLDWPEERTIKDMANDQKVFKEISPVFGPYLGFAGLPCKYWRAKPQLPNLSLTNIDTPPLLIIGVTGDPATPYKWAKSLVKSFQRAHLVTLKGEGHTGHNRGNKCVDAAVDSYFLTGKIPTAPLICAQSGN